PIRVLEYLSLNTGDAVKIIIEKVEEIKPRKRNKK
ncbi:unnamed protein product, partial [marine sediment metagenome]